MIKDKTLSETVLQCGEEKNQPHKLIILNLFHDD